MKESILTVMLLALAVGINAQLKVKYFKGSFSEAILEAEKRQKPLFVKTYTDWCYYCKKLDKKVLSDESVVKQLNENFIVIGLNMEEGEGPSVAENYSIRGYPTMLIFNSGGKEMTRLVGYRDVATLKSELSSIISP